MESISLTPQQRKDLIFRMKRETKPSRRLRMHMVVLTSDGRSPTEIARVLFCSRTTVYAVVSRFIRDKRAAFFDRERLQNILSMVENAGSFFQDETKLETNPKVGFCWMRKGKQRPLRTAGTNRKVWISGALNFHTGRFHWVEGEGRNDELFIKLLHKLRGIYRCHKQLRLATDNDSSHTSKRVEKYVEDSGGRIRLHPLPSWSPESNPVELVWCSLHEAVSRNQECSGLDDLVGFAEGYIEERQPFRLKLGKVYEQLVRSPP